MAHPLKMHVANPIAESNRLALINHPSFGGTFYYHNANNDVNEHITPIRQIDVVNYLDLALENANEEISFPDGVHGHAYD